MTNILRLDSSLRQDGSVSRGLADRVETRFAGATITRRDLVANPLPAIDEDWTMANFTPEEDRSEAQRQTLALSDDLIAEVKAADILLISAPIYNFAVPSALKNWIDHIARARVTFRYTEAGPVGLLEGKRAILALASGGTQIDTAIDFATPYLRHIMGFVGIKDVSVVAADAQGRGADAAMDRAHAQIDALAS